MKSSSKIPKGTLCFQDYEKIIKKELIFAKNKIPYESIQPASLDLRLGKNAHKISSSFLAINCKVEEKINEYRIKKIDISNGYLFKKNSTYLVELQENLKLNNNIFGRCNPKSSTGRLDIFCRTITDYCEEYEVIKSGYRGKLYLEITTKTFDISFKTGDKLNQLRLSNFKTNYINDINLQKINKKTPLAYDKNNKILNPSIFDGLKVKADLIGKNEIIAYKALKNSKKIIFNKINHYKINEFWKPIRNKNNSIIIKPGEFYILKSKEKINIPINLAAEMVPYDTNIGEFRVHYAGFFDPGFGRDNFGSHAVLEIKTHEVPFAIQDNQSIARLVFEKLAQEPNKLYGSSIKSNYQNQSLALSKHFKIIG